MKQIPLKDWPKGLFFPLMDLTDEAVASLDLQYEAYWEDGLGLHFAALLDTSKGVFAVRCGAHSPGPGTSIWCMQDGRAVSERINAFCELFELDEGTIMWRSPLAVASG